MDIQILQIGGPYSGLIVKATNPPIDHVAFVTEPECLYLLRTYEHTPEGLQKPEKRQFYVWREMPQEAAAAEAKRYWDGGYLVV
jgi:hypothetical protein